MPPIIGITSSFEVRPRMNPAREQNYLMAAYADAVFAAGGIPHALPVLPQCDVATLDRVLDSVAGLIFTGGPDLHPQNYGQPPHPQTQTMHPRRDAFELALFKRADERHVPLFAICLGFQVAHVGRGGQLVQHLPDLPRTPDIRHSQDNDDSAYHDVQIAADSHLARIMGTTTVEVASRHHQAVARERQGRGLRPVAYAADGILEASEDFSAGRFFLAVQWHPESTADRRPHRRLFEALVEAAGQSG